MVFYVSEVWINTVQHSEELICNIFRRPKYFYTEKKYVPPFASKMFFILKGWQCFNKCTSPLITKILLLQSFT